jgi:hypothetical protein
VFWSEDGLLDCTPVVPVVAVVPLPLLPVVWAHATPSANSSTPVAIKTFRMSAPL